MDELIEEVRARRRLAALDPAVQRVILKTAGLSQKRVGTRIGVSHQAVARYLDGSRRPRGATLVAYVELLDSLRQECGL